MPKRDDNVEAAQEVPAKVKKEKPAKTEEKPVAKVVQKSPLQERFKKFVNEARAGLADKINDISERMVQQEDDKVPVVFAMFSTNGAEDAEVDSEFNTAAIKDILFFYHTAEDKLKAGKVPMLEVLPPDNGDEVHILCYHEEG